MKFHFLTVLALTLFTSASVNAQEQKTGLVSFTILNENRSKCAAAIDEIWYKILPELPISTRLGTRSYECDNNNSVYFVVEAPSDVLTKALAKIDGKPLLNPTSGIHISALPVENFELKLNLLAEFSNGQKKISENALILNLPTYSSVTPFIASQFTTNGRFCDDRAVKLASANELATSGWTQFLKNVPDIGGNDMGYQWSYVLHTGSTATTIVGNSFTSYWRLLKCN